jgi:hypothetical protein
VSVVSDFRAALMSGLATSFPDAVVRAGFRQGVSKDADRINVYFGGWEVDPGRVVVARAIMFVRYWKANPDTPPADVPQDPAELEQASTDLLDALRAMETLPPLTRPWFFIVEYVRTDEDPVEWGVEARLSGYTANLGTIA